MLYYQADIIHDGELPVPVHFLMDEFANVSLPDEFDKLLSTMRSRQIFVSIIIQNLAQIKALLFIRGERPIFDKKYDILKHPNIKFTKDGSAKAYQHGIVKYAIDDWQNVLLSDEEYELYSQDDIEQYFKELEKEEQSNDN